jgi:hypothetical protein
MKRNTDRMYPRGALSSATSTRLSAKFMHGLFRRSWTRETSFDPGHWSPRNPAWGQCAVTALVVQDLLGGKLLCSEIDGTRHYWNLLPSRRQLDLTRHQFGKRFKPGTIGTESREYVLSFSETRRRYELLRNDIYSKLLSRKPAQELTTSK